MWGPPVCGKSNLHLIELIKTFFARISMENLYVGIELEWDVVRDEVLKGTGMLSPDVVIASRILGGIQGPVSISDKASYHLIIRSCKVHKP